MREQDMSVKQIIAWQAMNNLMHYRSKYDEVIAKDVEKMSLHDVEFHKKSIVDVVSTMNFYHQLLCHPMDTDRCTDMLANVLSGKIRSSLNAVYSLEDISAAVKEKDEKKLIEYYFECMDKLIDEGNDHVNKLEAICNSVSLYTHGS